MRIMKRLDLIKQTITDALGYDVAEVKIEGCVADITTTENEKFSVMLYERNEKRKNEPNFSLSSNGIEECQACRCIYFAYLYGSKACAIVAVDTPDFESRDEFGDLIYSYANPLSYE